MTKLDIRGIITNYLNQDASLEEISVLYEWVKKKENQETFKKLVQAEFLVKHQNNFWDSEKAFNEFLKGIEGKHKTAALPFFASSVFWKYAATVLVLIGLTGYFIGGYNKAKGTNSIIDVNQITLQLGNGEMMNLSSENDTVLLGNTAKIQLNNGVLQHGTFRNKEGELAYNTLRIPYGKLLTVTLEDGSTIKLNSGSELIYPSSFAGMDKRQVSLKGEAFFEIQKDTSKPFEVRTNNVFTRVFGTIFNISAYDGDELTEVVLVEGSVGVGDEASRETKILNVLKPYQKATKHKDLKNSFVIEDVDITPYISWTKGVVAFENERMSEIIKKLERQYNVEIVHEDGFLDNLRFTGMFDKEDIDSILKTIQTHTFFNYTKKGKRIIITKQ